MDALVPTPATTTNAMVPVIERVAAAAVPGEEEGVAAAAAPATRGGFPLSSVRAADAD